MKRRLTVALSALSAIAVAASEPKQNHDDSLIWGDLTFVRQSAPAYSLANDLNIGFEYSMPVEQTFSRATEATATESCELHYFTEASNPWLTGLHGSIYKYSAGVALDTSPVSMWLLIWMAGAGLRDPEGYY